MDENKTYMIIISKLIEFFEENGYKPGDSLPPEDDLAASLYVGRPALREALRVLEVLGFIDSARGRANVFVKDSSKGLLRCITIFSGLYENGYQGLSQMRANIEVLGVESFIEHATDLDIMELEFTALKFLGESDDLMIACSDDYYHIAFHQLLAKYSASSFELEYLKLCICAQFLSNALEKVKSCNLAPDTLKELKEKRTHQDIIDAIKARDTARAKEIVRNHVMYYPALVRKASE